MISHSPEGGLLGFRMCEFSTLQDNFKLIFKRLKVTHFLWMKKNGNEEDPWFFSEAPLISVFPLYPPLLYFPSLGVMEYKGKKDL